MTRKFKGMVMIAVLMLVVLALSACSNNAGNDGQTFAEARSNFSTVLTEQRNTNAPIPIPPPGVFDLVYFESEVGELAAFVSCDPGDGQLHPLIIWVVGGWGHGISDVPWSYPEWANDQTGSAFREAGILMMYPSFRGSHGNPAYFETMFGDIDDILAAYEFAAALPFVDPNRIYLGGHSTGGTRVLLASALTDRFRAVFSFGPVYDIGNHNRTQFTFNLNNREERRMRSPVHWLGDIASPTFVIEGAAGNATDIRNLERASNNENVHTFLVAGGDHFDVLAPITKLLAQKILEDTGATVNIQLTDAEIQRAMNNVPDQSSMPIMAPHHNPWAGVGFLLPFVWDVDFFEETGTFIYESVFHEDNSWEASYLALEVFGIDGPISAQAFEEAWGLDPAIFARNQTQVDGQTVYFWEGINDWDMYFEKTAIFQYDDTLVVFSFAVPEEFSESAVPIFRKIMYSVTFE